MPESLFPTAGQFWPSNRWIRNVPDRRNSSPASVGTSRSFRATPRIIAGDYSKLNGFTREVSGSGTVC